MLVCLRLAAVLSRLCQVVAMGAGSLLVVLTLVIMYDVIGRNFISTGSYALQELQWHLHGAIAVLAFGYAYTRDAHVRIDVVGHKIPPRLKLWLEVAAILCLVIPFLMVLAWYGYEFAERAFVRGEGSRGGLGLPNRWIIKSAVPVSAILTSLGALSVALRMIVVLRRPDLLDSPFEKGDLWTR
ncbi:TRAP transporter small permease subunit [Roseospira navarrensis]|uniref:TRAP transporter small permease protein n=1 Tax=Roseospira navarrensis TaxID=140058 RepID=A0A7X2D4E0_9PROT|nr:TRAP transporter small permease subunit [Roseospira navarrensis]MQX36100.1 TRAP transporter small permease subunit [Roseospira navarrensis]